MESIASFIKIGNYILGELHPTQAKRLTPPGFEARP